jgi:hypothetical protein
VEIIGLESRPHSNQIKEAVVRIKEILNLKMTREV